MVSRSAVSPVLYRKGSFPRGQYGNVALFLGFRVGDVGGAFYSYFSLRQVQGRSSFVGGKFDDCDLTSGVFLGMSIYAFVSSSMEPTYAITE